MKVFFADLDGTLLNRDKHISVGNVAAIKRWQQAGNQFVIASGRYVTDVQQLLAAVELSLPIIGLNGALTMTENGRVVSTLPLQQNLATIQAIQDQCEQAHFIYLIYTRHGSFVRQYPDMMTNLDRLAGASTASGAPRLKKMQFYFHQFYQKSQPLSQAFQLADDDALLKFEIFSEQPEKLATLRQMCGDNFEVTQSSPRNTEITAVGVNKGLAVKNYLLHGDCDESIAIGDGLNDISMFKVVDQAIAMHNAVPANQQAADWLTGDNDADGVAQAIDRILAE
ncbi:hypothetical protein LFAB_05700 [Lactiplantibacillus fabifermentans T30PCM01]|uniref:HAD family hydrolase n=1 Tax=Lactiplantibacillus fabifermentans T30PCM01 TaxID=1400520 RepID=W6T8P5_9LACO|nr:HAD family hydrolase [Lactiplantibacillus fabifermentans]ETY74754.1 hypothetical protein LFAB_05700 [Lactiplantibacillus fabifermentans T30PCM01]